MMHCDGLDNDCNGLVDDYFFNLGDPCTLSCPGVFLEGTYICQDDGSWTVCTVQMGGPDYPSEVCDGVDNNCNWATDEGFNIGTPCGAGACAGVVVCDGPNASTCNGGSPGVEICNGIDDDCDGETDEGNPGGGVACDGSDADLCNEGVTSCVGGSLTCTDSTGDNAELCNGQDDDCNPATGDGSGDPGVGSACDGNDADQCNEGVTSCQGGSIVCGDATGDSIEVCNGQDDDCDGATDEGFNLGAACDGKGECGAGTRECDGAGGARCSTDVGGSQDQHVPETADSPYFNCSDTLDNDCDDLIDTAADPDCQ
jgi:Notch-like protein